MCVPLYQQNQAAMILNSAEFENKVSYLKEYAESLSKRGARISTSRTQDAETYAITLFSGAHITMTINSSIVVLCSWNDEIGKGNKQVFIKS